jgi:hypothetical protein
LQQILAEEGVKLLAFAFQLSEMLKDSNGSRDHSFLPSARIKMGNCVDSAAEKGDF